MTALSQSILNAYAEGWSDGTGTIWLKRAVDLILVVIVTIPLAPLAVAIAFAVKVTSPGPALYWSDRVGRRGRIFSMPKFRTMKVGTPPVATHLMVDARSTLTPIGGLLRRSSLDEIPQLWSVLIGEMSFVGPRPALFNQDDLIALREKAGLCDLTPGVTGWAQINGRDELPMAAKVALDKEYLDRKSLSFDLFIIMKTVTKMLGDNTVTH